jgi:uncharacterized membrane protein
MSLAATVTAGVTMLAMDAVWLTLNAKMHQALIKSVQGSPPELRLIPALLVYVVMALAVYFFAIGPSKSTTGAAITGAALGASMYGVYDLTNLASLKGWTIYMTVTDSLWGTVLCATAAVAGFYMKQRFTTK